MKSTIFFFFLRFYLFIYLERGEGREKVRERNINVWLPLTWPPTGDLACNPGMCPDWESNQWPFGLQPELNPRSYTSQGEVHNLLSCFGRYGVRARGLEVLHYEGSANPEPWPTWAVEVTNCETPTSKALNTWDTKMALCTSHISSHILLVKQNFS